MLPGHTNGRDVVHILLYLLYEQWRTGSSLHPAHPLSSPSLQGCRKVFQVSNDLWLFLPQKALLFLCWFWQHYHEITLILISALCSNFPSTHVIAGSSAVLIHFLIFVELHQVYSINFYPVKIKRALAPSALHLSIGICKTMSLPPSNSSWNPLNYNIPCTSSWSGDHPG